MNCDLTALLHWIQKGLSPSETARVSLHVTGCPVCRQRLTILLALEEHFHRRRHRHHGLGRLAAAAALLLVLLIPVLWTLSPQPPPHSALATDTPYPIVQLTTRADGDEDSAPPGAYPAYSRGDYLLAERLLRDSEGETDRFLRGVSLYMLGRDLKAVDVLASVHHSGRLWSIQAGWYQANALVRLERVVEARIVLRDLRDGPDPEIAREAALFLERLP